MYPISHNIVSAGYFRKMRGKCIFQKVATFDPYHYYMEVGTVVKTEYRWDGIGGKRKMTDWIGEFWPRLFLVKTRPLEMAPETLCYRMTSKAFLE